MREGKLPLRTVLQNFINNVDSLEVTKGEKEDRYEQEFQELKKLTESLKNHPDFACIEGERECNRRKNRYKDILPYDRTRVVLQPYPGIPGGDYINANYIRGASGSRAYIASQGPLPHTVPDFWRMVVECDVQVIVMASNETEGGKHKCECYWVTSEGEERQFGNVLVTFVKSRQVCPDFLVRTLKIKYTSEKNKMEERTICQFHYMLWPDHGVPDTVRPLLDMVRLVRDCQASETLPVLVHCSAGCGRTGTICAIDYVWGLLRTGKLTDNLYLLGLVREMRVQRVAMVQTREQYSLLHQAVKELFRDRLSLIDAHPYENVSTDGNPLFLKQKKNKESDYEELFVSQEKQDLSSKASTPSITPTSLSTPSGSLTRKISQPQVQHGLIDKDNLRRSASTSSLDTYHIPSVPNKVVKPLTALNSVYPEILIQQRSLQSMFPLEPVCRYGKFPVVSITDDSTFKRPPLGFSKMEKEAENIAQKMESKEKKKQCSAFSHYSPNSNNTTPTNTPSVTPAVTPNSTPNLLHGINLLSAPTPPVPPPRSRTPSPIISIRKAMESQKKVHSKQELLEVPRTHESSCSPKVKRKSSEIVRRPSIQKLKELFERPCNVIECPNGSRLSRSASSVTSRTGLSLHSDSTMSLKVKRKSSLGSEEPLFLGNKLHESNDSSKLHICPPPPLQDSVFSSVKETPMSTSNTSVAVSTGKPPSSPVFSSPGVRRKILQTPCDLNEDRRILLSRLEDRPALPVKKSKSFRWSRPQGISNTSKPSNTSPELPRKKADLNTYFSLDRAKADYASLKTVKFDNSMKKLSSAFPSREGLKLSVYQFSKNPESSNSAYSPPEEVTSLKVDSKPQIPPKKSIGERYKAPKLLPLQMPLSPPAIQVENCDNPSTFSNPPCNKNFSAPLSAPPNSSVSFENSDFWERMQASCMENLYDQIPFSKEKLKMSSHELDASSPSHEHASDSKGNKSKDKLVYDGATTQVGKEYVNARVFKSNFDNEQQPRLFYVPLPSKRGAKEKGVHEYANCSVSGKPILHKKENTGKLELPNLKSCHTSSSELSPHPTAPIYDEVNPLKSKCPDSSLNGKPISKTNDSSPVTSFSPDYEPVNFGETSTNVDEVFETVNYELLENKERQKKIEDKSSSMQEYYLNRDLDSIAIQVYQDCQAYLLHGNNHSPVPSLMPRTPDKDDNSMSSNPIAHHKEKEAEISSLQLPGERKPDLEEVRSRVAVPPQGLRNRERRNSYRQAVSPAAPSYSKVFDGQFGHPMKTIHKYEKIWFESAKEDDIDEELAMLSEKEFPTQDLSSNLNRHMNISGKEALFKDKLEELHSLVSNLERKKLPDLSEEELSSKDSGSTSSLISRSAQSSRSSERVEPIYVNAPHLTQRPPSPKNRSRPELGPSVSAGRPHNNPLVSGASQYGTLTTTTSYPYKPKLAHPSPTFQKSTGNASSFTAYMSNHAATLPARSNGSPIPPPSGFGNTLTAASSSSQDPFHSQKADINSENCVPQYGLLPFDGQANRSGGQQFPADINRNKKKQSKSSFVKLPSSNLKGHSTKMKTQIVGDFAIVGSSDHNDKNRVNSVPLRQNDVSANSTVSSLSMNSKHPPALNPSVFYHRPAPKLVLNSDLDHGHILGSPLRNPLQEPVSLDRRSCEKEVNATPVLTMNGPYASVNGVKALSHNGIFSNKSSKSLDQNIAQKDENIVSETSSTDTSIEEEGIFHKISAPNILRKLRGVQNKSNEGGKRPSSPRAIFYSSQDDNCMEQVDSKDDREHKDKVRTLISPPSSPRPLAKAFGKLKLGSKNVAANFKSYLNLKGNTEDSIGNSQHHPLQKSASSGPTISVFSQVVDECKFPLPIPKKPSGPKELPESFRCYTDHQKNVTRVNRPRQQYL